MPAVGFSLSFFFIWLLLERRPWSLPSFGAFFYDRELESGLTYLPDRLDRVERNERLDAYYYALYVEPVIWPFLVRVPDWRAGLTPVDCMPPVWPNESFAPILFGNLAAF